MNYNESNEIKYIIVIGASAGGFTAITELVSRLPPKLPTAIFIVLHLAQTSSAEVICRHLAKSTTYECRVAKNDEPILAGKIYIAPPDYHLLLTKHHLRLRKGAHENRYRPAIDVLFRSAAAHFDSRVIGIILSGLLDDGTSGMSAIKRSGGTCIVQEPQEADYADMPMSVLSSVEVDYRVAVAEMGYVIDELFNRPFKTDGSIPEDVLLEAEITERMVSSIDEMPKLGRHSNFTCPDCGGGLADGT
ncbi:MAG: chemotaxis protein CheB [Sphingobacteriaceae bacterium]|nr:MAG: chemotaxis protein CheB [Sphingobacteriaceae bacterium]